jgi:hypothetical protein
MVFDIRREYCVSLVFVLGAGRPPASSFDPWTTLGNVPCRGDTRGHPSSNSSNRGHPSSNSSNRGHPSSNSSDQKHPRREPRHLRLESLEPSGALRGTEINLINHRPNVLLAAPPPPRVARAERAGRRWSRPQRSPGDGDQLDQPSVSRAPPVSVSRAARRKLIKLISVPPGPGIPARRKLIKLISVPPWSRKQERHVQDSLIVRVTGVCAPQNAKQAPRTLSADPAQAVGAPRDARRRWTGSPSHTTDSLTLAAPAGACRNWGHTRRGPYARYAVLMAAVCARDDVERVHER